MPRCSFPHINIDRIAFTPDLWTDDAYPLIKLRVTTTKKTWVMREGNTWSKLPGEFGNAGSKKNLPHQKPHSLTRLRKPKSSASSAEPKPSRKPKSKKLKPQPTNAFGSAMSFPSGGSAKSASRAPTRKQVIGPI
jgi:hypothetical protein